MSRIAASAPPRPRAVAPPPTPSRPRLLDYFLMLTGLALTMYLLELSPLTVEAADAITFPPLRTVIRFLPRLLRLPEGMQLLFPCFFFLQVVLGRRAAPTAGEWLWIIAWLGVSLLTAVAVWRQTFGLPERLEEHWLTVRWFWYLAFGSAMAVIALLLVVLGLFFRRPTPWTHVCSLALALWPMLPLAGIILMTRKS